MLIIKINLININRIAKILQLFILKRAGHSSCGAVRVLHFHLEDEWFMASPFSYHLVLLP